MGNFSISAKAIYEEEFKQWKILFNSNNAMINEYYVKNRFI